MMNGTEKSDSSIVPAKPANNVERSAGLPRAKRRSPGSRARDVRTCSGSKDDAGWPRRSAGPSDGAPPEHAPPQKTTGFPDRPAVSAPAPPGSPAPRRLISFSAATSTSLIAISIGRRHPAMTFYPCCRTNRRLGGELNPRASRVYDQRHGIDVAIAVAAAAAVAWQRRGASGTLWGETWIAAVRDAVPPGYTRDALAEALDVPSDATIVEAAHIYLEELPKSTQASKAIIWAAA
jgi:hypothetical protein